MVVIPAGQFQMGGNTDADEQPVRTVSVPAFLLGRTEVTQGQWKAVMGSNPSRFSSCGDECPVDSVSWHDAQEFIRRLNAQSGQRYRLPSEAEWEYAARSGSTTVDFRGDMGGQNIANCGGCGSRWDNRSTAPVAQFKPSSFGLYDMHGNVWEWVQDVWHDTYAGAPSDGSARTAGDQARRVRRGGSWFTSPWYTRAAKRDWSSPANRGYDAGFRVARTL